MASDVEFGMLVPHFTEQGSRERIFNSVQHAEELGFDLAFVRDHVYIAEDYQEHGGVNDPGFFTESLTTLGTLAGITDRIKLGTAILTPQRHPVKAAQIFGTLSYLSKGRVVAGLGSGWRPYEFEAVDMPFDKRAEMVRDNVEIWRRLWTEDAVSYDGEVFSFEDVQIDPKPVEDLPILYGGLSFRAVKWAAEFCDGWIPSRMPFYRLEERIDALERRWDENNRDGEPLVSVLPQTSIANDTDEAAAEFNFAIVKKEALRRKPIAGDKDDFTQEDLEGYLIWGEPEEICEHVERFIDLGVDQITFDMRASFDEYEKKLELIGDEVIPEFK